MSTVEDIKNLQKSQAALLRMKMKEVIESLYCIENGSTTIFVNGESEELQKHCSAAKAAIKLKKAP